MTRAEEAAMTAYPEKYIMGWGAQQDVNAPLRFGFIKGYGQAEKDMALTWEDVRKLCSLSFVVEVDLGREISDKQHYEEVLRRFIESKNK